MLSMSYMLSPKIAIIKAYLTYSYIILHSVCTKTSYGSQVFNDLGICQSDPPKSSKGGDIRTNVFDGFLTKLTFALKSGQ